MTKLVENASARFERESYCPHCGNGGTKLRAWANINGLDRMEVESISELSDDDVRLLASYGEGGIDGTCEGCTSTRAASQRLAALGGTATCMNEVPRRRADHLG